MLFRSGSSRAAEALPRLDPANAQSLTRPAIQLWRADAFIHLGRLAEAEALASEALETGRRRGEATYEAWGLFLLAEIAVRGTSGDSDAERFFAGALAIARKRGYRPMEALARLGVGRVLARAGRDEARTEIEAARRLLAELGMTPWLETADPSAR